VGVKDGETMQYKVIVVSARAECCKTPSLDREVEEACNHMAAKGWVLITAYPDVVQDCVCNQNSLRRAVLMIFARP
jgi:hypothetical protein